VKQLLRGSAEKAQVIITDVNAEGLKNVERDIANSGGTVLSLEQDVTSEAGWKKIIQNSLRNSDTLISW
jgi:NAD(P)-dependent dehydrogenase (short-subunit alcohol dehydrogenase family)